MECAQVRSGGHVLIARGYTKCNYVNGNEFILLSKGAEWQKVNNGGAIKR